MVDFKYDSYDVTAMKVAFQHLRQTQQRGFLYGLVFGVPIGILAIRNLTAASKHPIPYIICGAVPLITGSLIYGLYTWSARADYSSTASKVNRKYSKIINKVINY